MTNVNMNPNSGLVQSFVKVPGMIQVSDILLTQACQFQEATMMYTRVIRKAKAKLGTLNNELLVRSRRDPIEMIKSRVKKPLSTVEKLQRCGLNITVRPMMGNLGDMANIRVICSFVDDIYRVAEVLACQSDVRVVVIKDYIKNPKDSGYRSYHMIIKVPVPFSNEKKPMRVEVQVRTITMDFWANLDHQLKYKKGLADAAEISEELRRCAGVIAQTDQEMLNIRKRIEFREVTGEAASMSI